VRWAGPVAGGGGRATSFATLRLRESQPCGLRTLAKGPLRPPRGRHPRRHPPGFGRFLVQRSRVGQGALPVDPYLLRVAEALNRSLVAPSRHREPPASQRGPRARAPNSKETDPVAAIHDLTHGEGAETTMDCTGVAEARVAAVRSAGTWGRVALVGEGGTTTFDISQHLLRRQLTIHASWTFSAMGQAECARFIVDRKVPLKKLLTHRFKLDEADQAYRLFDTQTTGKGVFVF